MSRRLSKLTLKRGHYFRVGSTTWEARDDMNPSVRTIVELNIQYYRRLLKTETDQAKRKTIAKLLAEEEAKLRNLPPATEPE